MKKNNGLEFLKRTYSLQNSPEVKSALERTAIRTNEKIETKPVQKIANYLQRFLGILKRKDSIKRERGVKALKKIMHKLHIIKSGDIPESYFANQVELAHNLGHGNITITSDIKKQYIEVITSDQISTLDDWMDYFTSRDTDIYPAWVKYWAFRGMLTLSNYNKKTKTFTKRTKDTVAPFPELNYEALAYVINIIIDKIEKGITPQTTNDDLKKAIESENFGKLYAHEIAKTISTHKENKLENTKGEWKYYPQKGDCQNLIESLQGHNTGWCTAAKSTAESQLKVGAFHIYYSYDDDNEATIPRVAIRMEGRQIAEIRGIGYKQNLDPFISDVLKEKLKEFPDAEIYEKKTADMQLLTKIEKQKGALTKNEIIFLYEIKSKIQGFGYNRDPRIDEIKNKRNKIEDYAFICNMTKDQVIDNLSNLNKNTKLYIGKKEPSSRKTIYVAFKKISLKEIKYLNDILGCIDLANIKQSIKNDIIDWKGILYDTGENVFYPKLKTINGDLNAPKAKTCLFNSLETVKGSINIEEATVFKANSLETIRGTLNVENAITFEANSLKTVGWNLNAPEVTNFKVNSLETVEEKLNVKNAITFEANSLKKCKELYAQNAKKFKANSLETIVETLNIKKATEIEISSLKSCKYLYADNVINFKANSLEIVYIRLEVRNAITFEANALKTCKLIDAKKTTVFKANSLEKVEAFLEIPNATNIEVNSLNYVCTLTIKENQYNKLITNNNSLQIQQTYFN